MKNFSYQHCVPFKLGLWQSCLWVICIFGVIINANAAPEDWQRDGVRAALSDPDYEVKTLALQKIIALGDVGLQSELTALMNGENPRLAQLAIEALAASGVDADVLADSIADILSAAEPVPDSPETAWLMAWALDPTKQSSSVQALLKGYTAGIRGNGFIAYSSLSDDFSMNFQRTLELIQNSQNIEVQLGSTNALKAIGNRLSGHINEIKSLLDHKKPQVRLAAIEILMMQGVSVDEYTDIVIALLTDIPDRDTALKTIKELGAQAKELAPPLAEFRIQTTPDFSRNILTALGNIDASPYAETALALLSSEEANEANAAVNFFKAGGTELNNFTPQLLSLLETEDLAIQLNALKSLVAVGADPRTYVQAVHEIMPNFVQPTYSVPVDLLMALSTMEPREVRQYLPFVLAQMKRVSYSSDVALVQESIKIYFNKFSSDAYVAHQVAELLNEPYETAKLLALLTLEVFGSVAKDEADRLRVFFSNASPVIRSAAISAYVSIHPEASESAAVLIESSPEVTDSFIDKLGPLTDMGDILAILEPGYSHNLFSRYRFAAHYLSGGREEVSRLLDSVGGPVQPGPVTGSTRKNADKLAFLNDLWQQSGINTQTRENLTQHLLDIISSTPWKVDQIALLETTAAQFRDAMVQGENNRLQSAIDAVEKKIESTRPSSSDVWMSAILTTWGVHFLFWSLLIIAYPRSVWVQTWMFWNPWMRKLFGFGYINFLLTSVAPLRRLLFSPFREVLVASARVTEFEQRGYFSGARVRDAANQETQPIDHAIPQINGHIYLEGESGLGKSMFLSHLANKSNRILAYLPAHECSAGVFEAICNKLPGIADDKSFLESLIYAGAIDVAIDGLNEVSADIRASIVQFLQRFTHGNILIASQPIAWDPPGSLHRYTLEPLTENLIEEFLISRRESLPENATVTGENYQQVCRDYLGSVLSPESGNIDRSTRRILSNPMDLTIVAQMLSLGKKPDLFSLQAQQYELAATEFERTQAGTPFPLEKLAESAYQMRLNDEYMIPAGQFDNGIDCLERNRMVVTRHATNTAGSTSSTRYFRHDKIMEFFIVHAFLNNEERYLEHLSDARFQGVYFLLAVSMPLQDVDVLYDALINYAADTKDHSISDTFVKLVRERKKHESDEVKSFN